jgi:acylphosphatase
MTAMPLQARLTITGRVQGVGYRDWVLSHGRLLGLTGWVRNRSDGSVEALIVGEESAVGRMIDACRRGPPAAQVEDIDIDPVDLDVLPEGFQRLPTT